MKLLGDLLGREPLVQAQLDDLAVGSWQEIDHFLKQYKKLPFLRKSFRIPGRSRLVFKRILAAPDLFSMQLLRRVGDDLMRPRTGLRSVEGGVIEGLLLSISVARISKIDILRSERMGVLQQKYSVISVSAWTTFVIVMERTTAMDSDAPARNPLRLRSGSHSGLEGCGSHNFPQPRRGVDQE